MQNSGLIFGTNFTESPKILNWWSVCLPKIIFKLVCSIYASYNTYWRCMPACLLIITLCSWGYWQFRQVHAFISSKQALSFNYLSSCIINFFFWSDEMPWIPNATYIEIHASLWALLWWHKSNPFILWPIASVKTQYFHVWLWQTHCAQIAHFCFILSNKHCPNLTRNAIILLQSYIGSGEVMWSFQQRKSLVSMPSDLHTAYTEWPEYYDNLILYSNFLKWCYIHYVYVNIRR